MAKVVSSKNPVVRALTRKFGPLPAWAWAIAGALAWWLYQQHKASTAAASTATTPVQITPGVVTATPGGTGTGTTGGGGSSGGQGSSGSCADGTQPVNGICDPTPNPPVQDGPNPSPPPAGQWEHHCNTSGGPDPSTGLAPGACGWVWHSTDCSSGTKNQWNSQCYSPEAPPGAPLPPSGPANAQPNGGSQAANAAQASGQTAASAAAAAASSAGAPGTATRGPRFKPGDRPPLREPVGHASGGRIVTPGGVESAPPITPIPPKQGATTLGRTVAPGARNGMTAAPIRRRPPQPPPGTTAAPTNRRTGENAQTAAAIAQARTAAMNEQQGRRQAPPARSGPTSGKAGRQR